MGTEEFKVLLESLKDRDPDLYRQMLNKLKRNMNAPRVPRGNGEPKAEPMKVYTTLIRRCTCRHCGNVWLTTSQLGKGDAVSWTKDGVCKQMVIVKPKEEPITIESDTMWCDNCFTFIKNIDRSDLETRYMDLLRITALCRMQNLRNVKEERREVRI